MAENLNTTRILVIEDQKAMALLLKARIEQRFGYEVLVAHSLQQTRQYLNDYAGQIKVALCDLNLPDAPNGETVSVLRQASITTLVLTASYDEKLREKMYQERVADFVLKEGAAAIDYILRELSLLLTNDQREIWLVNLSAKMERKLSGLLSIHRFQVRVFDSQASLEKALQTKQPNLIIFGNEVDSNQWLWCLSNIRARFEFYQLPILAFIEGESRHAVKYMKYGATDFVAEPFSVEEFYARINQNIEHQIAYQEIKTISQTDALSGLYNRRFCFEAGEKTLQEAHQKGDWIPFALLVDIDHFKLINDTYGHPKGDEAIRYAASGLKNVFADYIVARFGGEEFMVLGSIKDPYQLINLAEIYRRTIEQCSKETVGVNFTVSIGIAFDAERFEQLIALADQKLYQSKENGRNQVSYDLS